MRSTFLLISILLSHAAFSQVKNTLDGKEQSMLEGKEHDPGVFVITADSIKHRGNKISFPSRYIYSSKYIEIDGTKYHRKHQGDIIAYQTENEYVEYFPGMKKDLTRVRKGKIILYRWLDEQMIGDYAYGSYEYYLKKGNDFKYAGYEFLEKFFADDKAVLQKLEELYPGHPHTGAPFWRKESPKEQVQTFYNLTELVDMYNSH